MSMNVDPVRGQVQAAFALAHVLQRIENTPAPVDADQYQAIIGRLKEALTDELPQAFLDAMLRTHPAAAEVYENLHYADSGLSRSSLEINVSSEVLAAQALARVSGPRRPRARG